MLLSLLRKRDLARGVYSTSASQKLILNDGVGAELSVDDASKVAADSAGSGKGAVNKTGARSR